MIGLCFALWPLNERNVWVSGLLRDIGNWLVQQRGGPALPLFTSAAATNARLLHPCSMELLLDKKSSHHHGPSARRSVASSTSGDGAVRAPTALERHPRPRASKRRPLSPLRAIFCAGRTARAEEPPHGDSIGRGVESPRPRARAPSRRANRARASTRTSWARSNRGRVYWT